MLEEEITLSTPPREEPSSLPTTDPERPLQGVLRILTVDDEPAILEIYQETLSPDDMDEAAAQPKGSLAESYSAGGFSGQYFPSLELVTASQGDEAVQKVQEAVDEGNPFAVVFLDMRMPPGPDGLWAAQRIRWIDPNVEILFVTAYSDVHPVEIARQVPPPDKLFYVQKPFHPHEILQFSVALGAKWRAERMLEKANRQLEMKVRERTAELQEANERLARLAITDELTRVYNRRHLMDKLGAELVRAERYQGRLAVLMIDLDRFKNLNDKYGHHSGDEVLKEVASILQKNVRATDVVARYGGEEFTIILLESDVSTAAKVAEYLRRLVGEKKYVFNNEVTGMTISIGVATYPETADTPDGLLRSADEALYKAKQAGRNRVVVHSGNS